MHLGKFMWRSLCSRPGRALLTVSSIVIGVAALMAFVMTTSTTRGAYKQMFSLVTGRASLEIVGPGETRFSDKLLDEIADVPHIAVASPAVRRLSTLFAHGQRVNLEVFGIVPEKDREVRDYEIVAGRMFESADEVVIDAALARRVGAKPGDTVKLLTERGLKSLELVGTLQPKGGAALRQAGIALVSLKKGQSLFKAAGKLDTVQIVVDKEEHLEAVRAEIAKRLPEGIDVRPPNTQSQLMEETLMSSEQGLRLSTVFSQLLAGFIILNTFLMNVGERRRQLSILRAIGATSSQIRRALLTESLLLGVVGVALGIGGGFLIGRTLNHILSNSLSLALPEASLNLRDVAIAAFFGLATSLAGALVPAIRAGRVSPLEGMSRVSASDVQGASWQYLAAGGLITAVSIVFIVVPLLGYLPIIIPTYTAPFLLIGIVMLSPPVMAPLIRLGAKIVSPVLQVEGRMAVLQLLRHRTRTTLTCGVLFVAAATGIGISYSILDNVKDIRDWYHQVVIGDFFIRAMRPDMASGQSADLPGELGEALHKMPDIAMLESASMVESRIGETKVVVVARDFKDPEPPAFDLVSGDRHQLRQQLLDGQVVIASVLGMRLKLAQGDDLTLETSQGPRKFRICGVTNEYMMGGYAIYMARPLAVNLLGVEGVDGYAIRAVPGRREELRKALEPLCDAQGVLLHSLTDVVETIEFTIRGIVACLWGLIGLGFLIGAFGVVNTLTMNVLEQTRELGMLRIVAMTRVQVRRTILTQALLIGMAGLPPGVVGGIVTAYVINLATMPSIGHPVEFGFRPWLLLGSLAGALAITVAAAWFPARRAAGLDVVRAMHYE
ncbi:MAG: FtsX-like permease family protein [Pirellulales bacterium]